MSITEIYNENIKDLLCPGSKKLDVKLNADGSVSVPGLAEETAFTYPNSVILFRQFVTCARGAEFVSRDRIFNMFLGGDTLATMTAART